MLKTTLTFTQQDPIMTTNMVQRSEKGWAGHFICSHRCNFRRHTLLSYNDVFISVSTVGNMIIDYAGKRFEQIGVDRYFETMAFISELKRENNPWQDGDVSKQISFTSPLSIDQPWKEQEANDMHEAVVAEITAELLAGNRYEH